MNSNVLQLMEQMKNEKINCSLMEVCGTHTMAIAKSGIRAVSYTHLDVYKRQ